MENWTVLHPFQALALSGGGYRGLFTAEVLSVLEGHTGKPIGRSFDLICGTSIGGVIALAVAFEIPLNRVVKTFIEHGEKIFPPFENPKNIFTKTFDLIKFSKKPRYLDNSLRDVVSEIFPKNAVIGDALHPLAIPTVNLTAGRPQVFKTRHKAEWKRDLRLKVIDVALATSAAPTFFPLAEIEENLYADGGLYANAPDLVALHEAEHFFGLKPDCFRMLSVGTTTQNYSVAASAGRNLGIADWMENQRLFSVIISAQQQFIEQIALHRLGDRYLRIDCTPSKEQADDLGLDVATSAAQKTLVGLARKVTSDLIGKSGVLKELLDHQPQLLIIRG